MLPALFRRWARSKISFDVSYGIADARDEWHPIGTHNRGEGSARTRGNELVVSTSCRAQTIFIGQSYFILIVVADVGVHIVLNDVADAVPSLSALSYDVVNARDSGIPPTHTMEREKEREKERGSTLRKFRHTSTPKYPLPGLI